MTPDPSSVVPEGAAPTPTCGAVMPRSNPPGRFVCKLDAPHPEMWHCASMAGVVTDSGQDSLAFWRDDEPAPSPVPASPVRDEVNGYDAAFWYESYAMLRDAVIEHLGQFVEEDDVAEESIVVDAIKRAGAALSIAPSPGGTSGE